MFRRSTRRGRGKENIEYLMRNESTDALLARARAFLTHDQGEEGIDNAERILAEVRERYRGTHGRKAEPPRGG